MGDVSKKLFLQTPNKIFIPSIVVYELEVGIAKSSHPQKRTKQLKELLEQISVLNFTTQEAISSAKIRASLEKIGTPIGPIDTLIAGYAVANNLTLVTRNLNEFQRVKKLKLENWF